MPPDDFWSPAQWTTLLAITEAVYPPLTTRERQKDGNGGDGDGDDRRRHPQQPSAESIVVAEAEWASALAGLAGGAGASAEDVAAFLAHNPGRTPAFRDGVVRLAANFPQRQKRFVGVVLWLLG
jgi:hypothetical protein